MVILPKHPCVKFLKNWIITGSEDCTIRIWDNENYHCLRVLGKPIANYETPRISETELLELIEKNDEIFHFGSVLSMDINDKYLVTGSFDGSCIIWKLPGFKPIERLILPQSDNFDIRDVALYNDYMVCCNGDHIGFENQVLIIWNIS